MIQNNKAGDMVNLLVCGKRINVQVLGSPSNPALLHIHGGPGDSCISFEEMSKLLSLKSNVILVDQYGSLRSEGIGRGELLTLSDYVYMYEEIRTKLNIAKWTLHSHSFGARIACLYAEMFPKSIRSIIFCCPDWDEIMITKSVARKLLERFKLEMPDAINDICLLIQNKTYNDPYIAINDQSMLAKLYKEKYLKIFYRVITHSEYRKRFESIPAREWVKIRYLSDVLLLDKYSTQSMIPLLKTLSLPTFNIIGKYDPICDEDMFRLYMTSIRCKDHEIFTDSAHFPFLDEKEKYFETLCSFIFSNQINP